MIWRQKGAGILSQIRHPWPRFIKDHTQLQLPTPVTPASGSLGLNDSEGRGMLIGWLTQHSVDLQSSSFLDTAQASWIQLQLSVGGGDLLHVLHTVMPSGAFTERRGKSEA